MKMKKILLSIAIILQFIHLKGQNDSIARSLIQSPPNGIFYSFHDFIDGIVFMQDSIIAYSSPRERGIMKGTAAVTPENKFDKRGRKVKNIWGFADGKNIYVWHELEFFPLLIKGASIGFEAYAPVDYRQELAAAYVFLFGLPAAPVYSTATKLKAMNSTEFYSFDFNSGIRYGTNGYKMMEYIPELKYNVILYRRSKKETEREISISIDDKDNLSFIPDSYKTIAVEDSRFIRICIDGKLENCKKIDLGSQSTVYIKVSETKDTMQPTVEKVDEFTGEFESVRPMNKERKRG